MSRAAFFILTASAIVAAQMVQASCAEKQQALIVQLQQTERDAQENGQRAFRVQQNTNDLINRFNQAVMRHNQIGFALGQINSEGAMLSNNLAVIQQNLDYLAPFNDYHSLATKQNLAFQAQNIELRLTELDFARSNARTDMKVLEEIARRIESEIQENFSELADMEATSRRLFQVRIDTSNQYTYFNTPEGRQECTEAELAEVQAQFVKAEDNLAEITRMGAEQKILFDRQTQLNGDIRAFIEKLKNG